MKKILILALLFITVVTTAYAIDDYYDDLALLQQDITDRTLGARI